MVNYQKEEIEMKDDGIRAKYGVVASMRELQGDSVCLTLDDVVINKENKHRSWEHECFFTAKEYDAKKIEALELTEKELAEIGFNLMIRLKALNEKR
jgi:hypothetical protein